MRGGWNRHVDYHDDDLGIAVVACWVAQRMGVQHDIKALGDPVTKI